MNKEQRRFRKTIKARKRHAGRVIHRAQNEKLRKAKEKEQIAFANITN